MKCEHKLFSINIVILCIGIVHLSVLCNLFKKAKPPLLCITQNSDDCPPLRTKLKHYKLISQDAHCASENFTSALRLFNEVYVNLLY